MVEKAILKLGLYLTYCAKKNPDLKKSGFWGTKFGAKKCNWLKMILDVSF